MPARRALDLDDVSVQPSKKERQRHRSRVNAHRGNRRRSQIPEPVAPPAAALGLVPGAGAYAAAVGLELPIANVSAKAEAKAETKKLLLSVEEKLTRKLKKKRAQEAKRSVNRAAVQRLLLEEEAFRAQQASRIEDAMSRWKWNIDKLKALFLAVSDKEDGFDLELAKHRHALHTDTSAYVSVLLPLLETVELVAVVRILILTATLESAETRPIGLLLLSRWAEVFTLPEVLRTLKVVDGARARRHAIDKIKRHVAKGHLHTARQLAQHLRQMPVCSTGGLNSGLCNTIRRWVGGIAEDKLLFFALAFPVQPWKELANLCHLKRSDFQLPWFLGFVFGDYDADKRNDKLLASDEYKLFSQSLYCKCKDLTEANVRELVTAYPAIPYRFIRKQVNVALLDEDTRVAIANNTEIDLLIWWYEELALLPSEPSQGHVYSPRVNQIIAQRLANGETPGFGYGKLMERLMTLSDLGAAVNFYDGLVRVAERRLKGYALPLEPPVLVCGDASSSMEVAIRTATIISSLLTALTSADLVFFHNEAESPPFVPRTIQEVMRLAAEMRTKNSTAPAAALYPLYQQKKKVNFLIMVTDEEENRDFEAHRFCELLSMYRRDVCPEVKVVFVSFAMGSGLGQMTRELKDRLGIDCIQLRLAQRKPDLRKVDHFLGVLAAHSSFFSIQTQAVRQLVRAAGIECAVECIRGVKTGGAYHTVSMFVAAMEAALEADKEAASAESEQAASATRACAAEATPSADNAAAVCAADSVVHMADESPVVASPATTYAAAAAAAAPMVDVAQDGSSDAKHATGAADHEGGSEDAEDECMHVLHQCLLLLVYFCAKFQIRDLGEEVGRLLALLPHPQLPAHAGRGGAASASASVSAATTASASASASCSGTHVPLGRERDEALVKAKKRILRSIRSWGARFQESVSNAFRNVGPANSDKDIDSSTQSDTVVVAG